MLSLSLCPVDQRKGETLMANRSMAKRRNRQKTMCQGCKIADGKAVQRIFPDGTKAYYHNNCLKKKLKYDQGKHIQLDES